MAKSPIKLPPGFELEESAPQTPPGFEIEKPLNLPEGFELETEQPDKPELSTIDKLKNYGNVAAGVAKAVVPEVIPSAIKKVWKAPSKPFEMAESKLNEVSPEVLKAESPTTQAMLGTAKGLASFGKTMAAPENLAIMAAMGVGPGILARVAGGYFSFEMFKALPDMAKQYVSALAEGDTAKAAEMATGFGATGAMAVAAGKHTLSPTAKPGMLDRNPKPTPEAIKRTVTENALKDRTLIPPERRLPLNSEAMSEMPGPGFTMRPAADPAAVEAWKVSQEARAAALKEALIGKPKGLPSPTEASGSIQMGQEAVPVSRRLPGPPVIDPATKATIENMTGKPLQEFRNEILKADQNGPKKVKSAEPAQEVLKRPDPLTPDEMDMMEEKIMDSQSYWGKSNAPEYFKGMGYSKDSVIHAFNKIREGKPLTEAQQFMIDNITDAYRSGTRESTDFNPSKFESEADYARAWPKNAGAVLDPAQAMQRLAEIAKGSKTYADFRAAVAKDVDLNDTVKFVGVNLRDAYNKKDEGGAVPPAAGSAAASPEPGMGGKERGFVTSVKESPQTAPEVAVRVEGRYNPISNAETVKQAMDMINSDYDKAISMVKTNRPATALSNTVAQLLIDRAQRQGRFEEAIELVETTAEKATAQGQSIQALSLYGRLSPEGILRYAQKVIEKANNERGSNLKLTPDAAKEIRAQSEKMKSAEGQEAKYIETAKLLKMVQAQVPATTLRKISTFQTIAQLLNPKTIVRNLIGNTGFNVLENFNDVVASGLDQATAAFTGKRSTTLPDIKAQWKGGVRGFKRGLIEAIEGVDTSGLKTQYELPQTAVFTSPYLKWAETGMNVTLKVPDRAFYNAAYRESLQNQLAVNKKNNPGISRNRITLDMAETAHSDALYKTFQDNSAPAQVLSGIKKVLNLNKEFGLGDMVIKYPKTPGNILSRGIEYSPAGFFNTLIQLGRPLFGKKFDQKAFVKETSRALTGTATMVGTGALLHELGIIAGRRDDDRDINAVKRGTGLGEYRINVSALKRYLINFFDPASAKLQEGDMLVSYDWFQPNAIPLSIGANFNETRGSAGGIASTIAESVASGTKTIAEQPMVQGVTRLMQKGDIVEGVIDTTKGIPSSFVPTLFSQVAQFVNNKTPETYNPNGFRESLNLALRKIPFAEQASMPRRAGVWGEIMPRFQADSNSFMNVFFNPAFVSRYATTPESRLVLDIYEKTGISNQAPRLVQKSIKIGNERRKLTVEEYGQMQQFVGQRSQEEFRRFASSKYLMGLPDTEKAKKLANILNGIGILAKSKVLGVSPKKGADDGRLLSEVVRENLLTYLHDMTPENEKIYTDTYMQLPAEARERVRNQALKEFRAGAANIND